MTDTLSPEKRSALMKRIRGKDTKPELTVRRMVHAMGFRYRLHVKDLPGRPDLVFPKKRKIIFVNGCFWHHHTDPRCRKSSIPKSRTDFWLEKFRRNAERDATVETNLAHASWEILVVWQCELKNLETLKQKIHDFLNFEVKK